MRRWTAWQPTPIRVALLRGAGGHFVAGTDITQFAGFRSGDDGIWYEEQLEVVIAKLESMRVATIAAVQALAVGAVVVLAAACDLRTPRLTRGLGSDREREPSASLSMPNYARLVSALGPSRTKAMLLTTDLMPADEAREMDLSPRSSSPTRSTRKSTLCAPAWRLTRHSRFRPRRKPCAASSIGRWSTATTCLLRGIWQQLIFAKASRRSSKTRTAVGRSLTGELRAALAAAMRGDTLRRILASSVLDRREPVQHRAVGVAFPRDAMTSRRRSTSPAGSMFRFCRAERDESRRPNG
jgi:enoyl-CoA hydratase/carnithine racemase